MEVLAVVGDLFFQARISAAARAAGRHVRFLSPGAIPADVPPKAVALVDLDAGDGVLESIERLHRAGASIVAFGPHLDTERRKAARRAGANRVLAKSKFVTELPLMMQDHESG